jgi:serine/threonine-protein kinase RsbW
MTVNRVSYTLDSTLETVNQAEATAGKIAQQAGFDPDTADQISMAVREATVNAVLHGNKYDPAKKVRLAFEQSNKDLIITISDEGIGLNETSIPDPLAPENLLKTSGRGIFLIRSFMDEVRFRRLEPGTELTLIKHVGGHAADAKENSQ